MKNLATIFLIFLSVSLTLQAQNNTNYGDQSGSQGNLVSNFGYKAGAKSATGVSIGNSNFGSLAGENTNVGTSNSNFGESAGNKNISGVSNSNFGRFAGYSSTALNGMSNFGFKAGYAGTTGAFNSNFGFQTGMSTTTGTSNSNFGYQAGTAITVGNYNSNFGTNAGVLITTGSENSNFGFETGERITSGKLNTNVGSNAGQNLTTAVSNSNFGAASGYLNQTGSYNSNFGYFSGYNISSGNENTFLGVYSGFLNSTGNRNVAIGKNAGGAIGTTADNVFVGSGAGAAPDNNLTSATMSNANSVVGANAMAYSKGTVNYNVALGYAAGKEFTFANRSTLVLNNQAQMSNPLLFGYFADNNDHSLATSTTTKKAQLAINTKAIKDDFTLTVNGQAFIGAFDAAGANASKIGSSKFGSYNLWVEKGVVSEDFALSKVSYWADYVFKKGYQLKDLGQVEHFINLHGHLPNIPSEEELRKDGYSLHDMNRRLMEKVEELTLYVIDQDKRAQSQESEIKQLKSTVDDYRTLARELDSMKKILGLKN